MDLLDADPVSRTIPCRAPTALAEGVNSGAGYASGQVIAGRYRLEAPIGAGGMGIVWRACDLAGGASVAVKLARAEGDADQAAARLQVEARILARIAHPGVVRALDFERTEYGDGFLVMELLEGCSLRHLLAARGQLPAIHAVRMLLPLAEVICHLHARGIVHRDLKPDNIFIAFGPTPAEPKLLDFGVAKLLDDAAGSDLPEGTVVGSPGYMAPEQALGLADVDERADVWGFCSVLYEAIAGTAALTGADDITVRRGAAYEFGLQPSHASMGGSAALWSIVERGLAHDRDRRFQSMRELGVALAEWLLAQGVTDDICGNRLAAHWQAEPELDKEAPWNHSLTRSEKSSTNCSACASNCGCSCTWATRS